MRRSLRVLTIAAVSLTAVLTAADGTFTEAQRKYWAFQPVKAPVPPKSQRGNPIDAFIVARLEPKKLALNPQADRITLLRRVSFDLIGLPPTPEEVDAFVNDKSADAYEKVVDRLLGSPHYGERWARHWLDLARFAESEGFKSDETRPNAWRYREYVIKSFNENKPYDRFVKEQIAGDELWPNDPWARIATGFNRHYPDESNARNLMQRRQEILDDVTDTVGATFMAMTYGCARCHDHKFDPILHTDYYRLQAFFANAGRCTRCFGHGSRATPNHCRNDLRARHWSRVTPSSARRPWVARFAPWPEPAFAAGSPESARRFRPRKRSGMRRSFGRF